MQARSLTAPPTCILCTCLLLLPRLLVLSETLPSSGALQLIARQLEAHFDRALCTAMMELCGQRSVAPLCLAHMFKLHVHGWLWCELIARCRHHCKCSFYCLVWSCLLAHDRASPQFRVLAVSIRVPRGSIAEHITEIQSMCLSAARRSVLCCAGL
jgi:hypothetical protein